MCTETKSHVYECERCGGWDLKKNFRADTPVKCDSCGGFDMRRLSRGEASGSKRFQVVRFNYSTSPKFL